MISYQQNFAKVYDDFVGDRRKTTLLLKKIIRLHAPKSQTILELATGTGELLLDFSKKYKVSGIDQSSAMLRLAKQKLPHAQFHLGDIRNFHLKQTFDIAILLFDSINHLLTLQDWDKTFKTASKHLNTDGLFIFDFNTESKLRSLSQAGPSVRLLKNKGMIAWLKINKTKNYFDWNINLFSKHGKGFKLVAEEHIYETAFPLDAVKKKLQKYFKIIECFDEKKHKPTKQSKRIYIVAKKL